MPPVGSSAGFVPGCQIFRNTAGWVITFPPQVVKLGRTIATIDVQLREEGSNTLVAQVSQLGES